MKILIHTILIVSSISLFGQKQDHTSNPYLSNSVWPIGHTNSAQSNAVDIKGPMGITKRLTPKEITYQDMGQFQLGQVISGPYANGKRVIWCNGSSFVAKIDYDNYNIISYLRISDAQESTGTHEALIELMDSDVSDEVKIKEALTSGFVSSSMSSVYIMIDNENHFISAVPRGIRVYGDVIKGDIGSGIKIINEYTLPDNIKGNINGMNMTFDGWTLIVTDQGYVVAVSRDFKTTKFIEMAHRNDPLTGISAKTNFVRNSLAVDKEGGIYIASINHMHKIVWTGNELTYNTKEGGWVESYSNELGLGSGSTPALMGFGDGNDQFVVITDGDKVMNMVLFWRNGVPKNWKGIEGMSSKRIAASYPVNFGNKEATYVQQEQGVTIDDYGMIVVNNVPKNVPEKIKLLTKKSPKLMWAFMGYMNGFEKYSPHGIEKLIWNPKKRIIEFAWINQEVSDPTCVPFVASGNHMFYTIGSRNDEFTFECVDSQTGKSIYHYIIGGARYNGFYSAPTIDDLGRIYYGGMWGIVRLNPSSSK